MIGLGRRSVPQGISAKKSQFVNEKSKCFANKIQKHHDCSKDFDTNGWGPFPGVFVLRAMAIRLFIGCLSISRWDEERCRDAVCWIGLVCTVFFASNRTGPVHFQTCIGLNRIDPGAALLYYVPDCTGLYRFFLCTGLYRLYYVPVCTGLYRTYRYNTVRYACIMCRYGSLYYVSVR